MQISIPQRLCNRHVKVPSPFHLPYALRTTTTCARGPEALGFLQVRTCSGAGITPTVFTAHRCLCLNWKQSTQQLTYPPISLPRTNRMEALLCKGLNLAPRKADRDEEKVSHGRFGVVSITNIIIGMACYECERASQSSRLDLSQGECCKPAWCMRGI